MRNEKLVSVTLYALFAALTVSIFISFFRTGSPVLAFTGAFFALMLLNLVFGNLINYMTRRFNLKTPVKWAIVFVTVAVSAAVVFAVVLYTGVYEVIKTFIAEAAK